MRYTAIAAFIVFLAAGAYADNNQPNAAGQAGGQADVLSGGISTVAADFSEKDINDQTVSLSSYRGEVVMLNFWGPWCQPCRREVPALESLQKEYKGKLVVIGAAAFSSNEAVELFSRDFSINYPVIYGSYDLMDKYGRISAFPTTIVIDKKGVIVDRLVGARTREQFESILKPLLAE
jgi:cytochrome c biogenesis protein CcmG, thiol:disulfide interchange protein DsbE